MKERPILFSNEMPAAIKEGRKTKTRRVAKFVPLEDGLNLNFSGLSPGHYFTGVPTSGHVLHSRRGDGVWETRTGILHSPYGVPGDRLWVKEAHWLRGSWGPRDGTTKSGRQRMQFLRALINAPGPRFDRPDATAARDGSKGWVYRHARYMERRDSRITLDVTDIKVERLHDITDDGAIAEGAPVHPDFTPRFWFEALWCSLHGEESWAANPWVWVVGFKRVISDDESLALVRESEGA
jgi:hypothetical protein